MSDSFNLPNSIWPNGIQVDSDGYAIFYPLGTNKIDVPTSVGEWPKGDKLVSPFVYENDKLVGFCDTKAMTVSKNTTVYLPYEHIDVDFSSIQYGTLQIHAPNATVKKAIWADSSSIDIPEAQFKYKGCTTVNDVTAITADYQTTDIVNGIWSEPLWDLENGYNMFYENSNLTTFTSDLSSLENGENMFNYCTALTTFTSDLSSLTNAKSMFLRTNLSTFNSDLSNLTDGFGMFQYCTNLTTFDSDLSSLIYGDTMFSGSSIKTFDSDLSSLRYGFGTFSRMDGLKFDVKELPNLEVSARMFNNTTFPEHSTFDTKMPKLIVANGMFAGTDNIEVFTSDLSNLKVGTMMFRGCYALRKLYTSLDNLIDGTSMVVGCPLDVDSFMYIADSINDLKEKGYVQWDGSTWVATGDEWRTITYLNRDTETDEYYMHTQFDPTAGSIDLSYDYETYGADSEEFAQIVEYCEEIANKGWVVSLSGVGDINPTNVALIDGEETVIPVSYWYKPVKCDKTFGGYVNANGQYFNIVGGRYIFGDDISTYGQFTSLEEAEQAMNLTKIERN